MKIENRPAFDNGGRARCNLVLVLQGRLQQDNEMAPPADHQEVANKERNALVRAAISSGLGKHKYQSKG
jgi:hypothetical protein